MSLKTAFPQQGIKNLHHIMDEVLVIEKKWTEIENIREYYEFFTEHEREFET